MPISALRLARAKAIQDSRFAVVQIGKAKFRLRSLWLRGALAGIFADSDRLQWGGNEPTPPVGPIARSTATWMPGSTLACRSNFPELSGSVGHGGA
jgi:hypothetical protein